MRIIKAGVDPSKLTFQVSCAHCGAELETVPGDFKRTRDGDQRTGESWDNVQTKCGYCKRAILFQSVVVPAAFLKEVRS